MAKGDKDYNVEFDDSVLSLKGWTGPRWKGCNLTSLYWLSTSLCVILTKGYLFNFFCILIFYFPFFTHYPSYLCRAYFFYGFFKRFFFKNVSHSSTKGNINYIIIKKN